jgi:hypothetical protein
VIVEEIIAKERRILKLMEEIRDALGVRV